MTIEMIVLANDIEDRKQLEEHFNNYTYSKKQLLSMLSNFSSCNYAHRNKQDLISKILQYYEFTGMEKSFRACLSGGK